MMSPCFKIDQNSLYKKVEKDKGDNVLKRITSYISVFIEKYMPGPFIFSIGLTFIVLALAIITTDKSFVSLVIMWGNGLWKLNNFAMQMALILILGSCLANSPVISSLLDRLVSNLRSDRQAYFLVLSVSLICCFINWGFGLVAAAVISEKVMRKNNNLNYPLILSLGYSGFLIWHGGLSGSIPLKISESSVFTQEYFSNEIIQLSSSIGSSFNLFLIIGTVLVLFFLLLFVFKFENSIIQTMDKPKKLEKKQSTFSGPLFLKICVCLLLAIYLFSTGMSGGINSVITLFLFLAIISLSSFVEMENVFKKSMSQAAGILLLFPFYSAIMNLMIESELAIKVSEFFISISTVDTFLVNTFLSAGLVNFFVPSGGGQWAIQAPIILPAAKQMNLDLVKVSMAIAWGDAWTNMIQPFWAIPLLALKGAKLEEMMKYLIVIFACTGIFYLGMMFVYK